ncbi:hypothetical protein BKN38_08115 [Helicobacter sp. CLO-3]|uniref:hypothetical protein n=1 Tax=unclassified Helicobacter TaxID=2593540 RepID=UPI0008059A66|nr:MULTISPECIES: hypothetical protein [unclassified Helicobacter]OBV28839.1 hypothetical protein BA723_08030 [Helicobacter sp. CLO-3]OHU81849.1 hypothetical protein BKN38_08115 [Helicobacter sp. CLO-3]
MKTTKIKNFLKTYYKPLIVCFLLLFLLLLPIKIGEKDANKNIFIIGDMERVSARYYDDSIAKIAATWAIVKLASKTASIIQRGEISFAPFGIGISLAPGELLSVISDNLERIANVLFALLLMLLLQQLGLGFLSFVCLKVLFPICLLLYLASFFGLKSAFGLSMRLLRFTLILWLFFPFSALVSDFLQQGYIEQKRNKNIELLQSSQKDLQNMQNLIEPNSTNAPQTKPQTSQEKLGFIDSLMRDAKELTNSATSHFERTKDEALAKVNNIVDSIDNIVDRLLELTAIFLLTSIVLPLGVFWLLTWAIRPPTRG